MGPGEPFDNYDEVMNFLSTVNHDRGLGIGSRHITISTCGVVNRIYDFSNEHTQYNLAISLHAPNDELRSQLMPINKAYPLDELMKALDYYSKENNIEELAIKSVENLINKNPKINIKNIDMIIVATTSTNMLMPGISHKIQAHFNIKDCICLDILAGCAGFVNALDIAQSYITTNKAKMALIVGTEILSNFIDDKDLST